MFAAMQRPGPSDTNAATLVHELAARGLELHVSCRGCRHTTRVSGPVMARLLEARRRAPTIGEAARTLRCSMCRTRTPEVRALPVASTSQLKVERRLARD